MSNETFVQVTYKGMTAWTHEECGHFRWWNTKQGPDPTDACAGCDAATGTWVPLFKRAENKADLALAPGRYCCDGFGFVHADNCPRFSSRYQSSAPGRTDKPGYKGNAPR